jgi:hypothetical protein
MDKDTAREVKPVVFFDKGQRPVGKDFSIKPQAVTPLPELEDIGEEVEVEEIEEPVEDPKDSSAMGSAESLSDLIPTENEAVVTEEPPASVEKVLVPTSTESSTPTSSPTTKNGSSELPADPAPATTPSFGLVRPPTPVIKPSSSASTAP